MVATVLNQHFTLRCKEIAAVKDWQIARERAGGGLQRGTGRFGKVWHSGRPLGIDRQSLTRPNCECNRFLIAVILFSKHGFFFAVQRQTQVKCGAPIAVTIQTRH